MQGCERFDVRGLSTFRVLKDRIAERRLNLLLGAIVFGSLVIAGTTLYLNRDSPEPLPLPHRYSTPLALRTEASKAERSSDFKKIELCHRKTLEGDPNSLNAQQGLARALAAQGASAEAWTLYRPIVETWFETDSVQSSSASALAWYADLAWGLKRLSETSRALEALRIKGGKTRLRELAEAHWLAAGMPNQTQAGALSHARRAVALLPQAVYGRLCLAKARMDTADKIGAERSLDEALGLARTGKDWSDLACYYDARKSTLKTAGALDRAARLTTSMDAAGWLDLFRISDELGRGPFTAEGRPQDRRIAEFARHAFDQASRSVRRDDSSTLYEISNVYAQRGNEAERRKTLLKACKALSPRNVSLVIEVANALEYVGEKEISHSLLKKAASYASPQEHRMIEWYLEGQNGPVPTLISRDQDNRIDKQGRPYGFR